MCAYKYIPPGFIKVSMAEIRAHTDRLTHKNGQTNTQINSTLDVCKCTQSVEKNCPHLLLQMAAECVPHPSQRLINYRSVMRTPAGSDAQSPRPPPSPFSYQLPNNYSGVLLISNTAQPPSTLLHPLFSHNASLCLHLPVIIGGGGFLGLDKVKPYRCATKLRNRKNFCSGTLSCRF